MRTGYDPKDAADAKASAFPCDCCELPNSARWRVYLPCRQLMQMTAEGNQRGAKAPEPYDERYQPFAYVCDDCEGFFKVRARRLVKNWFEDGRRGLFRLDSQQRL
jgi:hypothetical protein